MVVATLGPSHHQSWVQHVTLFRTSVDMGTPTLDFLPIHDDGGFNSHCVGLPRQLPRALTLDLPTLGIPGPERETKRYNQRLGYHTALEVLG